LAPFGRVQELGRWPRKPREIGQPRGNLERARTGLSRARIDAIEALESVEEVRRLEHGLNDQPPAFLKARRIVLGQVEEWREIAHVTIREWAPVQEATDVANESLAASRRRIGAGRVCRKAAGPRSTFGNERR